MAKEENAGLSLRRFFFVAFVLCVLILRPILGAYSSGFFYDSIEVSFVAMIPTLTGFALAWARGIRGKSPLKNYLWPSIAVIIVVLIFAAVQ